MSYYKCCYDRLNPNFNIIECWFLLLLQMPEDMDVCQCIVFFVFQIPEDMGDIIVSKAIDLWQKNGDRLQVKSDSMLDRSPPWLM